MASASSSIVSTSSQLPTSSTSPPPPPLTLWDVYISFRGLDTRYTFTDHLYKALQRTGIRTFMDDPELRSSGDVIPDGLIQAIQNSKVYVVVLSKNYASSTWCLDELVEILNCHKTMNRLVIPVYHNIDSSVVRHQTKSFKTAFKKHESRPKFGFLRRASEKDTFHTAAKLEQIQKWRRTLSEVAGFSGQTITAQRNEADIVDEIVEKILIEINPITLHVAKYPVGLDSHVENITALMSSHPGVTKIGIYGMGGVGKTTLAKAVYNQNYRRFQGSCFLENVRESSVTTRGLVCLQQQLIDNVLKCKNINIDNVNHGIELIRARISSIKVLIVFDDLDDPRSMEFLEGKFALGSIILITTRNEDLLDLINVEAKYKVNELGDAESRQLFAQHAFGDNIISYTSTKLFKEILEHAGGLPLALEVFGSNLLNQSEESWTHFSDELKQVSLDVVERKLMISFDALKSVDPMSQDIFLDIACFFMGWNVEEVVKIMETCYTFLSHNIDILKKRSLLTINNRDELGMHDLLRNMGRKIVRNSSPNEPGKHSRLWVSKDICHVLKNHLGTEAIKGIISSNFNHQDALEGVSFNTETFKRMSKLRFLKLNKVKLFGSFEQKFGNLRWLCWDGCPLKYLPLEFYPQKLVILELPHSKIGTMGKLNKVFEKLKTLNMKHSLDLTTTPNFNQFPHLEALNFEHCESLEEVHMSIGSLERLVILNLHGCVNLRILPGSICNLRALKSLNIGGCISLKELPTELGNLESLRELNAEHLTVVKLPDSIGRLSKLVDLGLNHNKNLKTLPDSICNLRSLNSLHIAGCSGLEELPKELGKIESLTKLNACGLTVSKLPDSINCLSKLVELNLNDNKYLEIPPSSLSASGSAPTNRDVLSLREKAKVNDLIDGNKKASEGGSAACKFTYSELVAATKNFSPDCLIGRGGFGRVYKGRLKSTNQVEDNNRLRSELLRKHHEIEKYKMEDWTSQNPHLVDNWDGRAHGSPGIDRSNYHLANPTGGDSSLNNSSAHGPSGTLGLRKEVTSNNINPVMQDYGESRFESSKINEARNAFPSGHAELHNGAISQRSSPSTTSFSSRRYQLEGEYDRRGLMTMADIGDPGSSLKQELIVKARENDAEISQLRKHLSEYSVKEVQLRNENYILEKRIAYMRMAFDQQQQELVDAASKAISYRQDIVEENIRLSYALQEAQQERSTFVSSLVPVIAEFFSPPSVADAQSIVSNLKVIFKHLQEQLNITESKLKESQYQIAPWRSDTNFTSFAQSPSHSLLQNELDLVPQPVYSKEELAMPSGPLKDRDWDTLGDQQSILDGGVAKNLETDDFGRYSALSSRNPASQVVPEQLTVSPSDSLPRNSEMTSNKQVKFSDTISSIEMDDPDMEGQQIGRDPSANWSSRNSPYSADDHIPSYSPYLPPVLEEPSSSFSEDDDPLPAVEGLQISGEPYPGQELQASGYSINGTTSCNFEWVRHLEDGSVNYIDGAKQPNYLVSADDVDNYLAIEVQPMDDRKRKGELVKVFANENRKIACDPEMHNIIRRNLQAGQASYRISQSVGYLDMWEPAILVVNKEGFNIKGTGSSTSLVTEKFSSATSVIVPCGRPTEFSIISGGVEHLLQAENSPDDIGGARDTIVLTLRLFILRLRSTIFIPMATTSDHLAAPYCWDVYLSFYGKDTRKNFTSHLYSALDRAGILTFRDDPALEKGEEISSGLLNAIRSSKKFVVVLSKNFAFSRWCLDELVEILACKRTGAHVVIPVFYYVDPSDLRYQKGSFGEALDYHKKRYTVDLIDNWKSALAEIAELSGYHLKMGANENESDTIQEIVENLTRLISTKDLHLEDYLVGIDSFVEEIYEKLNMESNDVRALGICGMGGIGKTTAAKAFYNKHFDNFDISCLVNDVKQHSRGGSYLLPLLQQLSVKLFGRMDYKLTDVESGMRRLKRFLCNKKALIVVDDLDQSSYSELLVRLCNLLVSGSRIIFTTRDANLVNKLKEDISEVDIYMMRKLEQADSLELFSYHAFRKSTPPESYKELTVSFITYAGGLPLALKVLGSSLLGRIDVSFWKDKLVKIQKYGENNIQKILQLSYDELGD